MVDCAEGTQRQLQRTYNPRIHVKKISKIFVTHMHGEQALFLWFLTFLVLNWRYISGSLHGHRSIDEQCDAEQPCC